MLKEKKLNSIKGWAIDDRPREKLLSKGKGVLSDSELLAILINSGNKKECAVALSKRILASVSNNLNSLGRLTIKDLKEFRGVGEAKAITIISALELGRRRRLETAQMTTRILNSQSVFEIMQPILGELVCEEFWVIYLNNHNKILYKYQLSKGGITGTLVDVRIVFKKALDVLATSIILCHNHPSGKLQPSKADKLITKKLSEAGKTLDIKVLDHLIITENAYFSFADENEL